MDQFPLISQAYYPNHREMVSNLWVSIKKIFTNLDLMYVFLMNLFIRFQLISPQFPSVIKVGQAHHGLGKVKSVYSHYNHSFICKG